jgi:hypothetical protein
MASYAVSLLMILSSGNDLFKNFVYCFRQIGRIERLVNYPLDEFKNVCFEPIHYRHLNIT